MRRAPLLALLVGCNSGIFTPETNPCRLYEYAINECSEDAIYYLGAGDSGDIVEYTVDLDCPAEEDLTEEEADYYTCLHELWEVADCTSSTGMLELALAASECPTPSTITDTTE